MSVYQGSRYGAVTGRVDAEGRRFLTERVPFRFQARVDNIVHVVTQQDTLFTLAGRYYRPLPRPAGYWWAIADYQPNPIRDPTIQLVSSSVIIVPALRTLIEDILGRR
jgi:hypothetical protein